MPCTFGVRAKARIERHNLIETKIREMMEEGHVLIEPTARAWSGQRPQRSGNRRGYASASPCVSRLRRRSVKQD